MRCNLQAVSICTVPLENMPLQRDRGYRVDPLVKVELLGARGVFSHITWEN